MPAVRVEGRGIACSVESVRSMKVCSSQGDGGGVFDLDE